jgi:hypothetical protein
MNFSGVELLVIVLGIIRKKANFDKGNCACCGANTWCNVVTENFSGCGLLACRNKVRCINAWVRSKWGQDV